MGLHGALGVALLALTVAPNEPPTSPTAPPSLWPRPQRMARARCDPANNASRLLLDAPITFDGPPALRALFARYFSAGEPERSLLFRHGAPQTGARGTLVAVATAMDASAPLTLGMSESYSLGVSGAGIDIRAPTQAGVIYALESLSQLVRFDPATGLYFAPCVAIDDAPRFAHRELMLDSGRFFLPVPLLKAAVDAMVQTKLNVLHLHMTDSESFPLVLESRPEFARLAFSPGERYTLPELSELANFSAARGIRLVVEVDLPGHTGNTGHTSPPSPGWCLVFPETCPTPRCRALNCLKPNADLTYAIIEDIVEELSAALPDAYLHFGGDEVLQDVSPPHTCWQTDPSIARWINATFPGRGDDPRGYGGPMAFMNDKIEAIATRHGKRSIRWEEAFYYSCCNSPTRSDPCPGGFVKNCKTNRQTIVHHWRAGNSWSGELAKLTSANGYDMISSAGWYLPGNSSEFYAIEPCVGLSAAACTQHVLGGGSALWQRDPSEVLSAAFPNAAVVAEVLWSAAPPPGASRDWTEAEPRLRQFRCALADRGVAAAAVGGHGAFGGCAGLKTDDGSATAVPTAAQLGFQDQELSMFIHFGICTFTACEHNTGDVTRFPPSLFNPTSLDTDQWARSAVAMGAKEICLSVAHEGGFALWPSTVLANYSVRASPWRSGKGDVVKDFVASCRRYHIKPCFYLAPPANGYLLKQNSSADVYMRQITEMLTELLTGYGDIHRLWFDHWCTALPGGVYDKPGHTHNATQYKHWIDTVRKLQPKTLMLPGPDGTLADVGEINPGVYPLWNSVDIPTVPASTQFMCNPNPGCEPCSKGPGKPMWLPVESDGTIQGCPLCPSHQWFWAGAPKEPPKMGLRTLTAREMWAKYMRTVGRGANMIMNVPPNQTGQIPDEFVAPITAFGAAVNRTFVQPIREAASVSLSCGKGPGSSSSVTLNLSSFTEPALFDTFVTMEDLSIGQGIVAYELDIFVKGQQNGTDWQSVAAMGRTVGHKVIDVMPFAVPTAPVSVEAARFTCIEAAPGVETVHLKSFGVFLTQPPSDEPSKPRLKLDDSRDRVRSERQEVDKLCSKFNGNSAATAGLKADDDNMVDAAAAVAAAQTVPLFDLWEHAVPAPADFVTPAPNVYNSSLLDAVATVTIAPDAAGSDAAISTQEVRGYFDVGKDDAGVVVFRYAPTQLGQHVVKLVINGVAVPCVASCTFTAIAATSSDAGFVQVAANQQHFVTSGANQSYFGVGENLAWTSGGSWEHYLTNLSAAGANYIRVWLTDGYSKPSLFLETQLGNYSLSNAENIDNLLKLAEERGIKLLMCTESFNFFCSKPKPTPCQWDGCVYNEKNGDGFLSGAAEFFTNEHAKSLYKQRLQYLVSRFAHSSAVFAWEFFNEIDIVDGFTPKGIAVWTQEMAQFLRSIDIYRHPISTSFCCQEPAEVWNLPEMDFVMVHSYSRHNDTDMADNSQFETVGTSSLFSKPTYVAETGEATGPAKDKYSFPADPTGIGLHNALWGSVSSMGAMTSMVWWWDGWVAPFDLYHHFTAVRKFTDEVAWPDYTWAPIGDDASPHKPPTQCTDKNPGGPTSKFTCKQQASFGKCDGGPNGTNPWMEGYCCHTCHPKSAAACAKCSAASEQHGGGHQAVDLGSGARALGMTGRALGTLDGSSGPGIVILWVQNKNNTFGQQNATKLASTRPQLNAIKGLLIHLGAVLPKKQALAGKFVATFTNTATGEYFPKAQTLRCPADCSLRVPVFTMDIAITVVATKE